MREDGTEERIIKRTGGRTDGEGLICKCGDRNGRYEVGNVGISLIVIGSSRSANH
jgi:hypothetical protein